MNTTMATTRCAAAACSLLGWLLFLPGSASAQTSPPTVNCIDVARPNLVYVAGSTALRPFLAAMAPLLAGDSPSYTIVYQSQGSCTGVTAVFDADPAKRVIKDIPAAGGRAANYAVFFKPDGSTQECFLDGTNTNNWPEVDLGISDVYASSCGVTSAPAGVTIRDFYGPIQPMVFVVPAASTQRSISEEAAYLAFGLGGGQDRSKPWIDPSFFFVRNASSGTQQMVAKAIHVPGNQWWGLDRGSNTNVVAQMKIVLDQPTAEKSLGIVSVDFADSERNNLKILAFKARGQSCGYLPDSSPTSRDKINVRDGHYPIWGPVHLFARTTGSLPNAAAGAFIGRFAAPRVDKSLVDAVVAKGLVPQCAMRVSRTDEVGVGAMSSLSPAFQCGCYFDFKANGATSCKACTGPAQCSGATSACNFGYCEAR